jgi:prephenate dehydrogenase
LPLHGQNFPRPLSNLSSLAVFGPGLIGGSILRARGKFFPGSKLRIWGRSHANLEQVKSTLGDECFISTDPSEVAAGAEAVIFCTPVDSMEELAEKIHTSASSARWFTDAGSVKGDLVLRLEKILGPRYLGSHPMAGSEKTGFSSASAGLFTNAVCILTPTGTTPPEVRREVGEFWQGLGCRITECDPFQHDEMVARVSHLPHLTAAALVEVVADEALNVAGPGFRDSTRIAMGDPEMWTGILMENRDAVLRSIEKLEDSLQTAAEALRHNDRQSLKNLLSHAAQKRARIS